MCSRRARRRASKPERPRRDVVVVPADGGPALLDENRLREMRAEVGADGYAEVLAAFAGEIRARMSVPEGGLEALARWAHQLAGSAATVGAASLTSRARALERAVDAADAATARALAQEIPPLAAATLRAVDALLPAE